MRTRQTPEDLDRRLTSKYNAIFAPGEFDVLKYVSYMSDIIKSVREGYHPTRHLRLAHETHELYIYLICGGKEGQS